MTLANCEGYGLSCPRFAVPRSRRRAFTPGLPAAFTNCAYAASLDMEGLRLTGHSYGWC